MTLNVIVHPEALADVYTARHWYEGVQPALGERFASHVVAVIESVIHNPLMFVAIIADIRRAPISVFPYHVYYETIDDRLMIFGVYHERRDPSAIASQLASRAANP